MELENKSKDKILKFFSDNSEISPSWNSLNIEYFTNNMISREVRLIMTLEKLGNLNYSKLVNENILIAGKVYNKSLFGNLSSIDIIPFEYSKMGKPLSKEYESTQFGFQYITIKRIE